MKNISESELEVMQVLWRMGECTSTQIVKEVNKKKEWKTNTIMTMVSRLSEKGYIEVIRNQGALLLYKPLIEEYDYKSTETNNFLERMYEGSVNNMLVAFAKSKKLTKKDVEELLNLIEEDE